MCVDHRLHFYVEKMSLMSLSPVNSVVNHSLKTNAAEMLKTKTGPGHLLFSGTHYLQRKTVICPILPFRALSQSTVHTTSSKSRLSHRTGFRHNHTYIALDGYSFGGWLRGGEQIEIV